MLRLIRRRRRERRGRFDGGCGREGVSNVFIFCCLELFFAGGGERPHFKEYVNGVLNVGTKGWKVSGDLAASVMLWLQLIRKKTGWRAKPLVQ